MITIEPLGDYNVAHIEANGYAASVMYEPNTTPLRPFESVDDLRAFAETVEDDFNSREPKEPDEAAEETIPAERISWRPDLFWRRFTPEEQILLISAAKEDPVVESFRMHLMMTPVVQSDDEVTINGMNYLVKTSLLTELRKNEILGGV